MPEQKEVVSLEFQSQIPGRSQLGGIHHVLKLLAEVDRRVATINNRSVAPMGTQGSSAASAIRMIDAQANATLRLVSAQAQLAKATVSTRIPSNPNLAKLVTTTDVFQTGPFSSQKVVTKPNGDTSTGASL